jgi:hypothetical protein
LKVRVATEGSNLPKELWLELYVAAIYITNRLATLTLENITPVEAFIHLVQPGRQEAEYKPDLSYLRAIGCRVYVNIPKERQVKSVKLDPYTEEGYLVGFEGSCIYRVYLPGRSRKVVRTSYCVFDESVSNSTQEEEEVSNTLTDTVEDTGLDQALDSIIVD